MFERGLYVHGGFADRMARLRACVEDLVASDLSTLTGGELADAVIELHSLANVLESAQLAVLERFDASGVASADGARSTAAWVRWRCRTTHAYARSRVDLAREVRDLPNVSTALADGQISTAHVRAIAGGRDAAVRGLRLGTAEEAQVQQAFSEAEPTFATAARELDPVALRRVVERWVHTVAPNATVASERDAKAAAYLHVSSTFEGMVAVDGLLDPETGAKLLTALESVREGQYRTGEASTGEGATRLRSARNVDALAQLLDLALAAGELPDLGGGRAHVQVTVPLATLVAAKADHGVEPAVLEGIGALSGEAARRIACDATVHRLVLGPSSVPLDLGRAVRTVPPAMRRAVAARDRHCRFPGCDRAPNACHAHHVRHWAHGGATTPSNLALLCSFHHHLVHEGSFGLTGDANGELLATRPDGTRIPYRIERRPPPQAA